MYRLTYVFFLSLVLQSGPVRVRADAAQEARVLFDAGVGASGAQRWAEARNYFKRSVALAERATTLLNLAVAEVKLGLGHDALRTLDAFDHIADPSAHAVMIERARALRDLAEEAAQREGPGVTAPVAAGAASSATNTPATEAVATDAPATSRDTPGSTSAPAIADTRTAGDAAPVTDNGADASHTRSLLTPRLLLAGGGLLTAGAIVGALGWKSRTDDLETCRKHVPVCDNGATVKRERNLALGLAIGSGAAALGLLTGGVVLLVREKRAHSLEVSWSGNALQVAGRF